MSYLLEYQVRAGRHGKFVYYCRGGVAFVYSTLVLRFSAWPNRTLLGGTDLLLNFNMDMDPIPVI